VAAGGVHGGEPPPSEPPPAETILGTPAGFGAEAAARESLALPLGTPLREAPDPRAPVLARLDAAAELPVLERRGGWALVVLGPWRGWVAEGAEAAAAAAPYPVRSPDPQRLARASGLFDEAGERATLGGHLLLTDVQDSDVRACLDRLAPQVVPAYRERFGVDPGPPSGEAILLFAREETYRHYERGEGAAIADLDAAGHAGGSVAALHAEGRDPEEVARLLVHELVHLLNRRALAPELPPWLEEGLAEALALSRIAAGRLEAGALGGRRTFEPLPAHGSRRDILVVTSGPRARLDQLVEALATGSAEDLETLLALPWQEFAAPAGRELRYAQAGFFVRYLLDGEDGRLASPFRAHLAGIARGEPADLTRLLTRLGDTLPELARGYRSWLAGQRRLALPPGPAPEH
jgi:hypothetical protein